MALPLGLAACTVEIVAHLRHGRIIRAPFIAGDFMGLWVSGHLDRHCATRQREGPRRELSNPAQVASYAFRDRPLSKNEMEILRLALSSFRDGSGQTYIGGLSWPGFRDYERSLAAVLGGVTPENKGVFDVAVPTARGLPFGISCKMAAFPPRLNQCSFMEMSNSAAKFRDHLLRLQITYASEPMLAGPAVIDLVSSWHDAEASAFDIRGSRYSVLAHDRKWERFQILCFPLNLYIVNPRRDIDWLYEGKAINGYIHEGGRRHRLWQYYPTSGGQLKYYPLLTWADWVSPEFTLEQPPLVSPLEKARRYFGSLWPTTA